MNIKTRIDELHYIELIILLNQYFKTDYDKIRTFIHANNPNLGGVSPYNMIILERFNKLKAWIKVQYEENGATNDL